MLVKSEHLPTLVGVLIIALLPPNEVSPMVVLVVVGTALTADNCTAFHLRNTPRLMVEVVADILAHSSDTKAVVAVERIEESFVCVVPPVIGHVAK